MTPRSLTPAGHALSAGIFLLAVPALAMHPNHPIGFDSEKAYQTGAVDHVDLFSGTLAVTVPVGPFVLNYSSSVWVYESIVDPQTGQVHIQAEPDRERNAGLGWHLGWGEVYSPSHWYNPSGRWLYVGPDGGRHLFFDTLHRGEPAHAGVFYTRDGSYLRMKKISGCKVHIESPDGSTRSFVAPTCGGGTTHRLTRGWSPFASEADPDFSVSYSADKLTWTMTDRWGRSHVVTLTDRYSWINRVITRVDVESVGGERAIYDFAYDDVHVDRSCKDDDPATGSRIRLPHLVRIDLPDGTSYSMKQGGERFYYNHCSGGMDDNPGVLTGLILPTRGKLEWEFQQYEFPPGDNNSVFNTSAGVRHRRLRWADGTLHGQWRYRSTSHRPPGDVDPEMHTEVVYPTGDCSRHFFNARYWLTPSEGRGWERGLGFSYADELDGMYLSSEVWTASSAGSCSGTKLRSTYLRYRHDVLPGPSAPQSEWLATNRMAKKSRVVYHDDGDRYRQVVHSDFDGLGHFRRKVLTGTLWSASATQEERKVTTDFNPGRGTYPGSYLPVDPSEPWILGLHASVETVEPDALGESVAKLEYGFDPATGALLCTRRLALGETRGSHDILRTYTRNALGQVTDVKRYGGDLQTLDGSGGPTAAGGPCGEPPAEPESWTRHTYQGGFRTATRSLDGAGDPAPFLSYDVDLDPSTGKVLASRDANGQQASFAYDVMGRLLSVTPQEGAETVYTYTPAAPGRPARVTTRSYPGGAGGVEPPLTEAEVELDDFGRVRKRRRKLPGGAWTEQEIVLNARGWTLSVSEWGHPEQTTSWRDYDPFGRAATVRPPEGATHDVKILRDGDRRVTTVLRIAGPAGEREERRSEEFDRHGRLRRVLESSGAGKDQTPTTYRYDVGSRLTESLSGFAVVQRRAFDYDNRGFLLAETHPEKGVAGNGTVFYSDYDSAGRFGRVEDGPNDLVYARDFLGRLTTVRDAAAGNRLLVHYKYDSAGGRGLGKVARAMRHNWVDLPWTPPGDEDDVIVREVYAYGGLGGALSWRKTKVEIPGETSFDFVQRFAYDDLGHLDWQQYPRCQHPECTATVGPGRKVEAVFEEGLLTEVPGWASALAYGPGGRLNEVVHANAVSDLLSPDAAVASRIGRLSTSGAAEDWDSGLYAYDGAGNISGIGADSFAYDAVGRLEEASVAGYRQGFTYDVFGSLTSHSTLDPEGNTQTINLAIDPSSNRLGTVPYDGAGNLVAWGPVVYEYDAQNRLQTVGSRWTYLYTAGGERVAAIDWAGQLAERQITFTLRGLGRRPISQIRLTGPDAPGGWSRLRDYLYAGGRLLAAVDANGEITHYHLDHLGTPRLLTGTGGATLSRHDFLPYGAEVTTPAEDPIRFTGHERDADTGLDYMHARFYSSHLARFQSVDSVQGSTGSPQSLNRYAYTAGNPVSYADPDGRQRSLVSRLPNWSAEDGDAFLDWTRDTAKYGGALIGAIAGAPGGPVGSAGGAVAGGTAGWASIGSGQQIDKAGVGLSGGHRDWYLRLSDVLSWGTPYADWRELYEPGDQYMDAAGNIQVVCAEDQICTEEEAEEWVCPEDHFCDEVDATATDPNKESGTENASPDAGQDGSGPYTKTVCVSGVCAEVSGESQAQVDAVALMIWGDLWMDAWQADICGMYALMGDIGRCAVGGGGGGAVSGCTDAAQDCSTLFY